MLFRLGGDFHIGIFIRFTLCNMLARRPGSGVSLCVWLSGVLFNIAGHCVCTLIVTFNVYPLHFCYKINFLDKK